MSSQTHGEQGATTAPSPGVPTELPPEAGTVGRGGNRGRLRGPRWPVVLLSVALVLALVAAGYLLALARAWQERADEVDGIAGDLGAELAVTRADLEEAQGTLTLVESQLDGAQEQIHELADTVAQTGDDREIQRQVAEYQAELFAAAAGVTGTMTGCINDQQDYVVALEEEIVRLRTQPEEPDEEAPSPQPAPSPGPTQSPQPAPAPTEQPDLPGLRQELLDSCRAASEAQENLQQRLGES